jgi:hypothetical protein
VRPHFSTIALRLPRRAAVFLAGLLVASHATMLTSAGVDAYESTAPPPLSDRVAVARAAGMAPFLVAGGEYFRASLVWEEGESRYLPFKIRWHAAEFSPDGSMIAVADPFCCRDATDIVVHGADGSTRTLGRVPGLVRSLSWAPEQARIAALTELPRSPFAEIWQVSTSGETPSLLYDGTIPDENGPVRTMMIDSHGGVSWSPDGAEIAFIGTSPFDGATLVSKPEDTLQLWVVPTDGSGLFRSFAAEQAPCEATCQYYAYPDWSPDGRAIAAYAKETGENGDPIYVRAHLVTLTRGAPGARSLTTFRHTEAPPRWSADGTAIAFSFSDASHRGHAYVISPATGANRPAPVVGFEDWQPCPAGQCVAWVKPRPPRPEVRLRLRFRPGRVIATGRVLPEQAGHVRVVVQHFAGQWQRVRYQKVPLTSGSRYRAVFRGMPAAGRCRVVAMYGGIHRGASTIEPFRCRRVSSR